MKLAKLFDKFNPFSKQSTERIECLVGAIAKDVNKIRSCHENRLENVNNHKKLLEKERKERAREQLLFLSVIDHLEDMVWAKTIKGKYIMANKAFREKFCYGMTWEELQGKDDLEIAAIFKAKVGAENHTFGEVCANSDEIIHRTEMAREFLEHGNINGKLVKLVVNKSPVYNETGVLFATCGSGRDVTWLHERLAKALDECTMCKKTEGYNLLTELFKDIEFEEGDHHVK